MSKQVFNVMDIGASSIICAQGTFATDTAALPEIQYLMRMQTQGLQRNRITNKQLFENSVLRAVHALEQNSKKKFQDIFVNFSSTALRSNYITTQQAQNKQITLKNIIKLSQGISDQTPSQEHLLHAIPLSYSVDRYTGIQDPRGMRGEVLEGTFHTLTVPYADLSPFIQAFYDAHLNVEAFVATPFASGIAASAVDERKSGVMIIDIGADFTHLSVFYKGQCIHATSLPIAGKHVTNDISYLIGCSFKDAEKVKRLHGSALLPTQNNFIVSIQNNHEADGYEKPLLNIEAAHLTSIIRARLEEILKSIATHLKALNLPPHPLRRAILCGGTAHIPRLKDLASQVLGVPVRIGTPMSPQNQSLDLTTAMGLLMLKNKDGLQEHLLIQNDHSLWNKIKSAFTKK